MERETDRLTERRKYGRIDEDRITDRQEDGWIDWQKDSWTDEWTVE
jgi:hypothetical protein